MLAASMLTAASVAVAVGFAAYAPSAAAQNVESFTVYGQRPVVRNADVYSVKVPFGDLNLSNDSGASVMLTRIHNAATTICGPESGHLLDRIMVYRPCVDEITEHAVAEFDNPLVEALNDRRMSQAGYYLAGDGYSYRASY